jgi:hypothetical protein
MYSKRFNILAGFAAVALMAVAAFVAVDPNHALQLAFSFAPQAAAGLSLAVFAPTAVSRGVQAAYEIKSEGDDEGLPGIVEIKKLIEDQGKAWKAFKETNDALVKAKADGKAVTDLEAKLDAVSKDIDKLSEVKEQVDLLLLKLARPGGMGRRQGRRRPGCRDQDVQHGVAR